MTPTYGSRWSRSWGGEGRGRRGGESFYGNVNVPVQIRKEIMLKILLDQRRKYIGGLCTKHCSVHKWLYTEYTQYYTPCFDGEKPPLPSVTHTERPRQPNALSYCFLYDSTVPILPPQFHNSGGNSGKFGRGLYSHLSGCDVEISVIFKGTMSPVEYFLKAYTMKSVISNHTLMVF